MNHVEKQDPYCEGFPKGVPRRRDGVKSPFCAETKMLVFESCYPFGLYFACFSKLFLNNLAKT